MSRNLIAAVHFPSMHVIVIEGHRLHVEISREGFNDLYAAGYELDVPTVLDVWAERGKRLWSITVPGKEKTWGLNAFVSLETDAAFSAAGHRCGFVQEIVR